MLLNFLTVPSALALSAETVELMWQTPLLGMAMVFAVLAILWGVLAIFKMIFAGKTSKEKAPKPVKSAPAPKTETVSAAQTVVESDDAELVAIITAAVAAYRQGESAEASDGSFRVVSFKRVGGRAWNSK